MTLFLWVVFYLCIFCSVRYHDKFVQQVMGWYVYCLTSFQEFFPYQMARLKSLSISRDGKKLVRLAANELIIVSMLFVHCRNTTLKTEIKRLLQTAMLRTERLITRIHFNLCFHGAAQKSRHASF